MISSAINKSESCARICTRFPFLYVIIQYFSFGLVFYTLCAWIYCRLNSISRFSPPVFWRTVDIETHIYAWTCNCHAVPFPATWGNANGFSWVCRLSMLKGDNVTVYDCRLFKQWYKYTCLEKYCPVSSSNIVMSVAANTVKD